MKFKKLSLLAAFALAVSVFSTAPAVAGESEPASKFSFSDDFETYALNSVGGANKVVAGNWTTSKSGNDGFLHNAAVAITTDPTNSGNKVLSIESQSNYNRNGEHPLALNSDIAVLDPSKSYKLDFEMYPYGGQGGGGLRFMVDGSNFYQIHFQGGNRYTDGTKAMSVMRGNTRLGVGELVLDGSVPSSSFPAGKWYTVSMILSKDGASWTVAEKATGNKLDSFSGRFTQPISVSGDTVNDGRFTPAGNVAVQFLAGGQGSQYVYYDNIKLEEHSVWTDGKKEADSVVYYNATKNSKVLEDGTYDIINLSPLRRIVSEGASDFVISVSADNETYTDLNVVFDSNGKWINTITDEKIRYIRFADPAVAENVSIYCEAEGNETICVKIDESVDFVVRENGNDVSVANVRISDSNKIVAGENSVIGKTDGSSDAEVYGKFVYNKFNVQVLGEMAMAEENGEEAINTYLEAKAPIIEAVSNAEDAAVIADILLSAGDIKISDIKDFDTGLIEALSEEELVDVANALITYDFTANSIEDVRTFITTIADEINLLKLFNLYDNSEIENVLVTYNASYKLDLGNKYYKNAKESVLTKLQGMTFENIGELQAYFASAIEDSKQGIYAIENFEDYDVIEVTGKGKELAGGWKGDANAGFGWDGAAKTGIVEDPTNSANKVLLIETRSNYNRPAEHPVVGFDGLSDLDPTKAYHIEYDTYTSAGQGGGGIRFMVGNGSYYELHFQGGNGYGDGTKRMSVINSGARIGENGVKLNAAAPATYFPAGKWYHIDMVFSNGEATWTVTERDTGVELSSFSGSFAQPITVSENEDGTLSVRDGKIKPSGNVAVQFMAGGQGGVYAYFDNIIMTDYNTWIGAKKEASNILYYNASKVMRSVENGAYDIRNISKIRRIVKNGSVDSFTMSVSKDNVSYEDIEVVFDGDKWINTVTEDGFRYVKFSDASVAEKISIYCEVDGGETLDVYTGKTLDFMLIEKDAVVAKPTFVISDTYRLSASGDSGICGNFDGLVDVSIYGDCVYKAVKANIIGEMKDAEMNGQSAINAYIAEKAPIINAISNATDKQVIYDIIKGTGTLKLADITDFDMAAIEALEDAEIIHLAEVLTDYTFEVADTDDVREFIKQLTNEIALLDMLNLADGAAVAAVLTANNASYGLDLANEYYVANKTAVDTALSGRNFKNIPALKDAFEEAYTTITFAEAFGYAEIGKIVVDCEAEIGYDKELFEDLNDDEKEQLYQALKENQSDLTTTVKIKEFIDEFEPEESESSGGFGGGGGGGGGGGLSVLTPPAIAPVKNTEDGTVVDKTQIYSDVPVSHWAYDSIRYLTAKNAVSGYENGEFGANKTVTRAEFVKILLGGFGIAPEEITEESVSAFGDVANDKWYAGYFAAAYTNGIVKGDNIGNANPDSYITRQEIAVMIERLVAMQGKQLPKEKELLAFDDDANIDEWAYTAVAKMQIAGIINGDGNGSFKPKANATRAESAKMIYGATTKAYIPVAEEAGTNE